MNCRTEPRSAGGGSERAVGEWKFPGAAVTMTLSPPLWRLPFVECHASPRLEPAAEHSFPELSRCLRRCDLPRGLS
jgi:hypothetical protein